MSPDFFDNPPKIPEPRIPEPKNPERPHPSPSSPRQFPSRRPTEVSRTLSLTQVMGRRRRYRW